jgi:hypothetical protein
MVPAEKIKKEMGTAIAYRKKYLPCKRKRLEIWHT